MSKHFDFVCDLRVEELSGELGLEKGGRVQRAVDEAFLREVEPYVPMVTGALINSGITNTVIGSGEIVYDIDNKARRLYYGDEDWNWSNGGVQTVDANGNPGLRGSKWAERFEQAGGKEKLVEAAREALKK